MDKVLMNSYSYKGGEVETFTEGQTSQLHGTPQRLSNGDLAGWDNYTAARIKVCT